MQAVRIAAVIALAIAVVLWLLVRGNDNSQHAKRAPARAVSAQTLAALPSTVHHPVYWAGPKRGFTYELTRTNDGRIFVRYLPVGVAVGTKRAKYLTIGTYPVKNALATVRAIAKRSKTAPISIRGGGIAVQDGAQPTSVYLAYPRSPYQVEIFDPSPAAARRLALSGKVVRLGSRSAPSQAAVGAPKAATVADLRSLASSAGHSVYWAGAIPNTTLELTQTSGGRIYIRYLPRGVSVGDRRPYLTVGTYPVRKAVAAVETIAKRPGAQRLSIAGGVAVVDPAHANSVFLAFRGSNFQIEVFDRSAARARQLATSGRITPIR